MHQDHDTEVKRHSLFESLKYLWALQELKVTPDLMGDNARYLLKDWNFFQVSVDPSLSEVEALLVALEAGNRVLLNPAVIIW
ncbi:hypothetical protein ATANTOWER_030701, partial [Ataeniobius toweri]|nr:hypothetical protein [Ataeniobius toweri]